MRYLLDTNVIAEPTKLQPNQKVIAYLSQYAEEVAIASVSWHELWFGVERLPPSRKRQNLQEYLQNLVAAELPILPYSGEAARWFAMERSRLVKNGQPPSYPDGQIAAIAKVSNLILVTRNTSDYICFQDLLLENWW